MNHLYLVLAHKWRRGTGWLNSRSIHAIAETRNVTLNSLVPARFDSNFKRINFKLIIKKSSLGTCCEISCRCMPQKFTDKSILDQVMAWCCQATNRYLRQCWPRSMWPSIWYQYYRPQWIKKVKNIHLFIYSFIFLQLQKERVLNIICLTGVAAVHHLMSNF